MRFEVNFKLSFLKVSLSILVGLVLFPFFMGILVAQLSIEVDNIPTQAVWTWVISGSVLTYIIWSLIENKQTESEKKTEEKQAEESLANLKIAWQHLNWDWKLILILGSITFLWLSFKFGQYLVRLVK